MAQPYLNRRKVFLGAIQSEDAIEILDVTDGGILIKDAASMELELVNNDRSDVARDTLSNLSNVMGSKAANITITGELIPSGDVTVAPSIDVVLRSCGMGRSTAEYMNIGVVSDGPFLRGETITGSTSGATGRVIKDIFDDDERILFVTLTGTFENAELINGGTSLANATCASAPADAGFEYKFISKNMEWGTFSLWEDDFQTTIHSAMGTIAFNLESSLLGTFTATLKGPITFDEDNDQWGDGTMPTPEFANILPAILDDAKLQVSDMDGSNLVTSLIGQTVSFDAANDVILRRNFNSVGGLKGTHIPKRVPITTIGVELIKESEYNVYKRLFNNADSRISFRLGDGTPGKTIEMQGQINFNEISIGNENNLLTQSIISSLVDNGSGDNEFSLLFI